MYWKITKSLKVKEDQDVSVETSKISQNNNKLMQYDVESTY